MRQSVSQVIESMKKSREGHEIIPTGFPKLDRVLDGGFYKKELIVIGAHTGVGKSQLAGQIAMTVAHEGIKSAYFSLEISSEMVLARMIGAAANIKPTRVRFANLTQEEFEAKLGIITEMSALGNLLSFYDDVYSLDDLTAEIENQRFEFVVVDFIQNVMDRVTDEYSRLSKVSLTLQKLAKDTGACILVLSQLSNTAAKEGAKTRNVEFKGSGAIAMVADLAFILEREEDGYGTNLVLKKNRRGVAGDWLSLGFTNPGGMLYVK